MGDTNSKILQAAAHSVAAASPVAPVAQQRNRNTALQPISPPQTQSTSRTAQTSSSLEVSQRPLPTINLSASRGEAQVCTAAVKKLTSNLEKMTVDDLPVSNRVFKMRYVSCKREILEQIDQDNPTTSTNSVEKLKDSVEKRLEEAFQEAEEKNEEEWGALKRKLKGVRKAAFQAYLVAIEENLNKTSNSVEEAEKEVEPDFVREFERKLRTWNPHDEDFNRKQTQEFKETMKEVESFRNNLRLKTMQARNKELDRFNPIRQKYRAKFDAILTAVDPKVLQQEHNKFANQAVADCSPEDHKSTKDALGDLFRFYADRNEKRWKKSTEAPIIGIDLGTTYSSVAVLTESGMEVIEDRTADNIKLIPSYVLYESPCTVRCGLSAKTDVNSPPDRKVHAVKRVLGRAYGDPIVSKSAQQCLYNLVEVDNKPRILIKEGGRDHHIHLEQACAVILAKLKKMAQVHLNCENVPEAVISVPAHFGYRQRQATKDAAEIAGFRKVYLINEPRAAAIAYQMSRSVVDYTVLVFDLGGGTLDVAVINVTHDNLAVKVHGGEEFLGGNDFDEETTRLIANKFKAKTGIDILENSGEPYYRLRVACEEAKKLLSSLESTRISLEKFSGNHDLEEVLTREEFVSINQLHFGRCIKAVETTLDSTFIPITKESIKEVVLVGGSSKIPRVRQMLQDFFGPNCLVISDDPDEAIAKGAAYQAAMISMNKPGKLLQLEMTVQDVTKCAFGIHASSAAGENIVITRNTPIPLTRTVTVKPPPNAVNTATVIILEYASEGQAGVAVAEIPVDLSRARGSAASSRDLQVTMSINVIGEMCVDVKLVSAGLTTTKIVGSHSGSMNAEEKNVIKQREIFQWNVEAQ